MISKPLFSMLYIGRGDIMVNATRCLWTILSFMIPLVGVTLYLVHNKKRDAKLYGMVGVIGIFVYIMIGIGFV